MRAPWRAWPHRTRTVLAGTTALATIATLVSCTVSRPGDDQVTISSVREVYPTAEGDQARVGVTVTTDDGSDLSDDLVVKYTAGPGVRVTGGDQAANGNTGQLIIPKGTPSGTTRELIAGEVPDDADPETSESIPLVLDPQTGDDKADDKVEVGVVVNASDLPYLDDALPVQERVADLLARMTVAEKVGQMTQAERGAVTADTSVVATQLLGSVLSGGGSTPTPNTPEAWVEAINGLQDQALSTRLQIPLLYGVDAVHGHNNLQGATIFPHNIGLGATRDPDLVRQIGQATAAEVRATGVPWNFSPCVCVARDERWGRTYESFGEDPALVISMETIIDGMQGTEPDQLDDPDRVLATAKHYAGDGSTAFGSSTNPEGYTIDQGVTVTSREEFAEIAMAPYGPAVTEHRVGTVMPSFSSVDFTDDGTGDPVRMHAHTELITDVLKGDMGFTGFLISDWEGIHQITDPDDPTETGLTGYKVRTGVNAGIDMFMEPNTAGQFIELLTAEIAAGRVSQARVDDAVTRILTKKFELGLFDQPYASTDNLDQVGSPAHRELAREAVAGSQVLLKNDNNSVLPLPTDANIYVAGRSADDLGNQAGGWTITWQGFSGEPTEGTTILEGIREVAPDAQVTYSADASAPTEGAQVGVVVVGETPYAEGFGDVGGPQWAWDPADDETPREPKTLTLAEGDRAVIDKVCSAIDTCVVLVVSGRPQVIGDQIDTIDALVASWLPGSEGAGVADVLFGQQPFTGRLPMTWPASEAQVPINVGDPRYQPLFPYGWGLRTSSPRTTLLDVAGAHGDKVPAGAALTRAAQAGGWNADGSVRDAAVLDQLDAALAAMGRSAAEQQLADAVVAVARDAAQAAVVAGRAPAGWQEDVAQADHAWVSGDPRTAFGLLRRAAG